MPHTTIRNAFFYSGVALLIFGCGLAYWAFQRFDELPNYLRIAFPIPIFLAYPLLRVDDFRKWDSLEPATQLSLLVGLLFPFMMVVAAIGWYITAPAARA